VILFDHSSEIEVNVT